jgi:archaeosortase A (PGF-CTERM-specific)
MSNWILETINLAALILLGAGFLWKDNRAHTLRMTGWLLEGIYWLSKVPTYLGEDDQFNALGAAAALPVFWFLAYHESRSFKWHDDYPPLRFITGAMFIAGMGYFFIDHFPPLSNVMVDIVAHQSVWLANLGGYDFRVGELTTDGVRLVGIPIIIVLECTAIQAYFVAGSFLFGCRGAPKKRALVFFILVPVVWLVNLFRNAIVIILVHENGFDYFDFAHNVIGKGLSLVSLIILVLVAFIQVPELYEDINGLFELPWRKGPKHDYMKFVGRLYGEKAGKE